MYSNVIQLYISIQLYCIYSFQILFQIRLLQNIDQSSWGCPIEWSNSDREREISYGITYMKNLKKKKIEVC